MSDRRNLNLVDALPLPAVLVGPDARIQQVNAEAAQLNQQAVPGRPFVLAFRQPDLAEAVETCLQSQQPGKVVWIQSQVGQEARFDVSCRFVRDGGITGVLVCFTDVTSARQAAEIRSDFVANVSHELRTPLTAILGFIETMQGAAKDDPKAQTRFLAAMADEAGRMNRLVRDLLSLSRVEEEARMRPTDPVDMDALTGSVIANLTSLAAETGGRLIYAGCTGDPVVPADADQMRQVLSNLVENALNYGGDGVTVTLSLESVDRSVALRGPGLRLRVADNGPGIEQSHIARLTERFYRIDHHRSRQMGGTGLGLAIVKHIVNRHRGRLRIESSLGEGSVFTVILPRN